MPAATSRAIDSVCSTAARYFVRAVNGQREPERQASGATGQLGGVVRGVPRLPIDLIQVARVLGVCGAGGAGIAVQQRAAVIRCEEPLVRVDDETVGQFDAGEA